MTLTSAYLLVSHGSRDPRPQMALERLAYLLKQQLSVRLGGMIYLELEKNYNKTAVLTPLSPILVETASLELTSVPLNIKIQQVAQQVNTRGQKNLKIIPLFLLPGVHVTEDIPKEIAIAQQVLGHTCTLELCPYLGSNRGLTELIARQFPSQTQEGKIILAHGSRYPGGNEPVKAMAISLNAVAAYWSVAPSLAQQITILAQQGKERITIVPYFLFPGGIIRAIAQQIEQLQTTLPQVQLQLAHPLGATPELAQLIIDRL
ncbi:cobalamin biosynthesis protein [Aphanothece sacrum FPU1]|uniref:Cobalamin biosynthesis protein n=1 Tax=Aphanothece sacrum FPU1 TaxID=1920663 RepID=A0A401IEN4_APHSA|nr:cobalamin biosynthesis protein [Aphanothece sacrum FPU1]